MADNWYELEIMALDPQNITFYSEKDYNRSDENAGFDLYAASEVHVEQTPQFIPFGITCRLLHVKPMPNGMPHEVIKTDSHFWLAPRSSIFKSGLMMANSVGVIDSSYRGELKAPVWSMTGKSKVEKGDRLFQILAPDMGHICEVLIVDSLPETERGEGGFGSSGLK